jgi:hypothetical protein
MRVKELQASECPAVGPDFKRLSVYANCFNKVIAEFKVYGPLLADIKVSFRVGDGR